MSNPRSKLYISIIGSTGSIGRQTLEVVEQYPEKFKINGLACYQEIGLLEKQIQKFKPEMVAVYDAKSAEKLRQILKAKKIKGTKVLEGIEGWNTIATLKNATMAVFASKGILGLKPLFSAIKAHKKIALANKELLVIEGEKIMKQIKKYKNIFVPIDSEHSAIFQALQGENYANIEKIILTCSGGPFYFQPAKNLETATIKQTLNHPVWQMGKKISVDSATLMNKGFEVIAAKHIFDVTSEQIEILIHPEGVVHSFVQLKDGSLKAILAPPDMRLPITYALFYPERAKTEWPRLDFTKLQNLTFHPPDFSVFEGPLLAHNALKRGSRHTRALVKANDRAVGKFLQGELSFLEIYKEVKDELKRIDS